MGTWRGISVVIGAAVAGLGACSPAAWGQTDGFRDEIPIRCRTEEGCRDAIALAERRVADCAPNTIGKIRCRDAEADLHEVATRHAHFTRAAEEARRNEGDERLRQRRAEYEAESKRREQERLSKRREDWIRFAVARCEESLSKAPCDRASEEANAEARERCAEECAVAIGRGKEVLYRRALRECVDAQVDTLGREKPDCRFALPNGSSEDLADRRDPCAAECVEQAKPLVARAKLLAPPSAKASGAGGAAPSSGGSSRVKCCDGTPSPTCMCPGHQGCCSHHGGMCGCF